MAEIGDYIAGDNPTAAAKLEEDVESRVAELLRFPLMCRAGRMPGTREMVVRSNYMVIYKVDEKTVTIMRVKHGSQQWPEK
jgi:addiction module RelE/StbE family toxin